VTDATTPVEPVGEQPPPATTNQHIRDALVKLMETRQAEAAAKAVVAASKAAWQEANATILAEAQAAGEAMAAAETMARELVLAHYHATKERKPVPGAEIAMTTAMEYDAEAALAWAREKGLCLIPEQLDAKALAAVAKATPLPFVKFTETPAVKLASDLAKALAT
jgi:hypothetical protein